MQRFLHLYTHSVKTLLLKYCILKFSFRSQQQNRREIKMAYVTFAIVGLFFCLNMPRFVLGSFEVSNTWLILRCVENKVKYLSTLTFYRWDCISRLLMVVNSSINFLIYCTGSDQFKVSGVHTSTHWIHLKSKDVVWP